MGINNLLNNVETIRVSNAAAAAQTAVNGTAVDLAGKQGVRFTAALGTVSAGSVLTLTVEQSDSGDGDWEALEGAVTHTDDGDASNTLLIVDAVRPSARYVRAVLTRTTANAAVDGIIADVYGVSEAPVTQGATVLASGTAPNPAVAA